MQRMVWQRSSGGGVARLGWSAQESHHKPDLGTTSIGKAGVRSLQYAMLGKVALIRKYILSLRMRNPTVLRELAWIQS